MVACGGRTARPGLDRDERASRKSAGFTPSSLKEVADRRRPLRFHVGAIPPAAAERLKERDRVGVARGFGLGEAEQGLLVSLLGIELAQIVDVAEPRPPA